ncbi:glutathione S-transferase family protein [Dickeya zeae]|uniref:glutathione S-transferase family protein n=1 Tax=Dickeya zeae TaxID=204042 RepID=UPI001C62DAC0|nr:glutathione S-transferase family protein [Dickeya zeae]
MKIHHLYTSRSERLLFLAKALAIPHDVIAYQRDPETNMAPAALKAKHTLGTAPLLEDGDLVIAESGAAVIYMAETYGNGRLLPPKNTHDYVRCQEIIHFNEGTLMSNMIAYMSTRRSQPSQTGVLAHLQQRIAKSLQYLADILGEKDYLFGTLTIADIMSAFALDLLAGHTFPGMFDFTADFVPASLCRYIENLRTLEAYQYSQRRDF